jgi:hypothetical protein
MVKYVHLDSSPARSLEDAHPAQSLEDACRGECACVYVSV